VLRVSRGTWEAWLPPLLLALLAALPALSLIGHGQAFLAGPFSELPVKIWSFETLDGLRLLGGEVLEAGFPHTGAMNNPDPLGAAVYGLLRPGLGRAGAYNLLVIAQLWAAMTAAWLLARELSGDPWAALVAGVGFGLTPLVLVYPLACGVTDILQLWPYPLAVLFLLRALGRTGWRDGLWSGCFAGLGFVTCPYDFVVFSSMAFPMLIGLPLAWRQGLLPREDAPGRPHLTQWGRALGGLLLGALLAGGWYALWMKLLMSGGGSQVSEELVAGTRHIPPYRMLHPEEFKRFTAFGIEYFAIGKGNLVVRDMVSRFYRAFSPGLLLMGLSALALLLARGRRWSVGLWLLVVLFAALASLGPFMPWSPYHCFDSAVNPAWLAVHHLLPGGDLILEPFRYALVVALGLGVAGSIGVAFLARRWGRWLGPVMAGLVVLEVAFLSPVPVPLPIAELSVSPAYQRLDEVLGPGAIIELPFFDAGSQRFERRHFLHQLVHGRPIADEIVGFPARYLVENQYTAQLLEAEKPFGAMVVRVERPDAIDADRARLAQDGFAGIIVDPSRFDSEARAQRVMGLLEVLGPPVPLEDRLVYALPGGERGHVDPGGTGE
jgi:hypothetical protein